ncbi:MAG: ATP-binding cassette domain-containing protein [Chitinophagaceae bacterium]|nr:MAG: ATP-binding cassette domain-containing protein [Chitinophagaceae bacterium]
MKPILHIQNLSVHYHSKIVLDHISFDIPSGTCWMIRGLSGSGKTTLGKALSNHINYQGTITPNFNTDSILPNKIYYVENWYQFSNLEGQRNYYYQQRYNHQQRRDTITVSKELEKFGKEYHLSTDSINDLISKFDDLKILDEQLFEISSGEHKKLQLIKALWLCPQVLIIDQPYTGLDKKSRVQFNQLFNQYIHKGGTLILLSNDDEMPSCTKYFATLKNGKLIDGEIDQDNLKKTLKQLPSFLTEKPIYTSTQIVSMKNVAVVYDGISILTNINWSINAGERWLLQGHNGSGKSTLLSLITADHPQAYANDIKLFGVQRGGGESIWDIKKRIGLISPEMHWYFDANATVAQSIASGFFDSNGQYQNLRYAQKQQLNELLHFLDLYDLRNELLTTLPLGKQRLSLLGRTILKNPPLLILDEPCQGLDNYQTQYFNNLVDEISKNGVTIIYVGHFETQLPQCITHSLVLQEGKTIAQRNEQPQN